MSNQYYANTQTAYSSRIWWAIALTLFGTAVFMLGVIGHLQYDPAIPLLSAAYYSAQLFFLESSILESSSESGNCVPLALHIARWLAPVTLAGGLIQLFRRFWREEWDALHIRWMKDHSIVCGLGREGLAAVNELRRQGEKVLVIDRSPDPVRVQACHEHGTRVLIGDASSREVLRRARIDRASLLIAACSDDNINCEIASHALELRSATRASLLECRVQTGNIETRRALQRLLARQDGKARSVKFHFFDTFDPEARQLLVHDLPLDHGGIRQGDPRSAHLVILGLGRMGRAVAIRAAELGVFANQSRLKISVVDREADRRRGELLFHYPRIIDVCDIEFHEHEVISPRTRNLLEEWCADQTTLTSVAVCLGDERSAIELVVFLEQMLHRLERQNHVRVGIRTSGKSGLARMLRETHRGEGKDTGFCMFGTEERAAANCILGDNPLDQFAKKIHAAYVEMRKQKAVSNRESLKKLADDPALKEWGELMEDMRESNRQQADHIYIKLRGLGLDPERISDLHAAIGFSDGQIEVLAEWEHRRWVVERLMANWTLKPLGEAVKLRKESPYLIGWDEGLPESIKEYDREAVREIPYLLNEAMKISQPHHVKATSTSRRD